jgi:probable rRNA maturation factor
MSVGSTLLFGALPAHLKFSLEQKRSLQSFVRALSREIAAGRACTCLLTNDRELQRLNNRFLGHDYPTDVLSFPAAHSDRNLGEIAISAERAAAQAAEFGHRTIDEIRVLMLHGILHLIGMDHERDHGEMQIAEDKWRAAFGLPGALIARASASRHSK